MNKIYVIANQKGGVGKTTLAVNFAFYLSKQNNILFIDLDPQGSATFFLGDNPKNFVNSSRDIFFGRDPRSLIIKNRYNFDMIPAKLELEDVMSTKNINALIGALMLIRDYYDAIIIDTRPSVDSILKSAIAAAETLIIPLVPEYLPLYDLEVTNDLIREIDKNNNLRIKYVINLYDSRISLHKILGAKLEKALGENLLTPYIHNSAAFKNAIAMQQTIFEYDNNSRSTKEISLLASKIFK